MIRLAKRLLLVGTFLSLSGCLVTTADFNEYKAERAVWESQVQEWAKDISSWVYSNPATGEMGTAEWLAEVKPFICRLIPLLPSPNNVPPSGWNCGPGPSGPPPPAEPDCDWGEVCPS